MSATSLRMALCLPVLMLVGVGLAFGQCLDIITNPDFGTGNRSGWPRFRIAGSGGENPHFMYLTSATGLVAPADGHAAGTSVGISQTGWYAGIYQEIEVEPGATYRLSVQGQILSNGLGATNPTVGDDTLTLFWVNGVNTSFTTTWPGQANSLQTIQSVENDAVWLTMQGEFTPAVSPIIIGTVVYFYDPSWTYAACSSLVDNFCIQKIADAPATPTPTATPSDCVGSTLVHHSPNTNNGNLIGSGSWGDPVWVVGDHPLNYAADGHVAGNPGWNLGWSQGEGMYQFDVYHQQVFNVTPGQYRINLRGWVHVWAGWWQGQNWDWNTRVDVQLLVDGAVVGSFAAYNTAGRWDTWLQDSVELESQNVNSTVGVRLRASQSQVDVDGTMRSPIYFNCNVDDISLEICLLDGAPACDNDIDGDNVCDEQEVANVQITGNLTASNRILPDSDGDGLLDGEEDANRNGAQDAGETSTRNIDSDGDGYEDGLEVLLMGTDPLNANSPGTPIVDADGDGLPASLDPNDNNRDTDGDRYDDLYDALVFRDLAAASDASRVPNLGDINGDNEAGNLDSLVIQALFLNSIDHTNPVFQAGGAGYDGFRYANPSRNGQAGNLDSLLIQAHFLGNLATFPLRF